MGQAENTRELQMGSHKIVGELLISFFLVFSLFNSFSRFWWMEFVLVGSMLLLTSIIMYRKAFYRGTLQLKDQTIECCIERKNSGKKQKRKTRTYSLGEIESMYVYGRRIGFKLKNKRIIPFALICSDIDDKRYVKEWAKKHQIAVHYRFFSTWF